MPCQTLTPKQLRFVEALLHPKCEGVVHAYKQAYNWKGKSNGCYVEASRLRHAPKITQELDRRIALREKRAVRNSEGMKRYVLQKLQAEAEQASSDSARIRALELLGRTVALFTDSVTIEQRNTGSESELLDELRARLGALIPESVQDAADEPGPTPGSDGGGNGTLH